MVNDKIIMFFQRYFSVYRKSNTSIIFIVMIMVMIMMLFFHSDNEHQTCDIFTLYRPVHTVWEKVNVRKRMKYLAYDIVRSQTCKPSKCVCSKREIAACECLRKMCVVALAQTYQNFKCFIYASLLCINHSLRVACVTLSVVFNNIMNIIKGFSQLYSPPFE